METALFWAAAAFSLATFAVHTFRGGVVVARPLLADTSLPPASKWLNYYCWHIATITLLFTAGGFAFSAMNPDKPEIAAFVTALAAALSVLSVAVAMKARINPLRFPSTWMLATIAAIGLGALLLA